MADYFLIGGKDDDLKSNYLENVLVNLTRKINPTILFFSTASLDKESSINHFIHTFDNILVDIKVVTLYKRNYSYEELDELFLKSDVIYFGGGNTSKLYQKLIENQVDKLLVKYSKTNKIYAGISAGAIIYTLSGMGDSYSYLSGNNIINYQMINGLSLINIKFCPHYQKKDLYIFNDETKDCVLSVACEDDTAVLIRNNQIVEVYKANPKHSVYKFVYGLMEPLYESFKIHSLGPLNTYSYFACLKYENKKNIYNPIILSDTIRKSVESLKDDDLAIIPIENSLDGYLGETLDLLYKYDLEIIEDLNLHISFSLVSNSNISDIKKIYVQFKAKGQCLNYLETLNKPLVITDSNIESLNLCLNDQFSAAIVPNHILDSYNFKYVKENVCDKTNNYTRFIVVRKRKDKINYDTLTSVKASLLLMPSSDRSGILYDMLKMFYDHKINLNAIISRPTKEGLGKYYFYVEFSDQIKNLGNIIKVLLNKSTNDDFKIKCLGIYPKEGDEKLC